MIKLILIILTVILSVYAKNDITGDFKFKPIGYASYQGGLVKSGTYKYENDINDYWYQKVFANLGFKKRINHWLSVTAAVELNMRLSYKSGNTNPESEVYSTQYYIDEARGDLYLIDRKPVRLGLTLGYFRFSCNPDVHNLGNNLFRTYKFPSVIIPSEFDFPYVRLCGLNLHASFVDGMIFNDFISNIHVDFYPPNDLSIADILGFNWRGIRLGFGVQLDRILQLHKELSSPKNTDYYSNLVPSDTVVYNFASTKLLAFFNLDIKKIFYGEYYPTIFGNNDLKFFFEMNIMKPKKSFLLIENQNSYIPISMGLLLPTFKILDVLSIEYEYLLNPEMQSMPNTEFNYLNNNYNDPKWSIYAKRSFSNFSIIFQIAHDHLQLLSIPSFNQYYHDVLIEDDDFYYQLKFRFNL